MRMYVNRAEDLSHQGRLSVYQQGGFGPAVVGLGLSVYVDDVVILLGPVYLDENFGTIRSDSVVYGIAVGSELLISGSYVGERVGSSGFAYFLWIGLTPGVGLGLASTGIFSSFESSPFSGHESAVFEEFLVFTGSGIASEYNVLFIEDPMSFERVYLSCVKTSGQLNCSNAFANMPIISPTHPDGLFLWSPISTPHVNMAILNVQPSTHLATRKGSSTIIELASFQNISGSVSFAVFFRRFISVRSDGVFLFYCVVACFCRLQFQSCRFEFCSEFGIGPFVYGCHHHDVDWELFARHPVTLYSINITSPLECRFNIFPASSIY